MGDNEIQHGIKLPMLPFLTREMLAFGAHADLDLEVVQWSIATTELQIVGLTRQGVIKHLAKGTATATKETSTFGIPDFPITLSAFVTSAAVEVGELYVSVYLRVNKERVYKLMSGYVTHQSGLNFPATQDSQEFPGGGSLQRIQVSAPAAGADWKQDIPVGSRWRIIGVTGTLVTDVNAGDRRVHLQVGLNTGTEAAMFDFFSTVDHPASTTRKYTFASVGAELNAEEDDDIIVPIPHNLQMSLNGDI